MKETLLKEMLENEDNNYIKTIIFTTLMKLKKKNNRKYSLLEKIVKERMKHEKESNKKSRRSIISD